MERLFNEACDPKQLSPLTLAFVGDAAFELFVRERLASKCSGAGALSGAGKVYGTAHANFNRRRDSGF